MNWELKKNIYRVEGDYNSAERALIFELEKYSLANLAQEDSEND